MSQLDQERGSSSSMQATLEGIKVAFASHNLKYEELGNMIPSHAVIYVGFALNKIPHIAVTVIIDPDGESFQLRTDVIASVPDGRHEDLCDIINDVNCRYRWTKFFIDDDGDIIANCDCEVRSDFAGEVCFVMLMRFITVVEQAYADIMKGVWA